MAGRLQAGRPRQDGIVYQGAAYEGLTCDFLEIAFAAGGKVLSEDGTKAEFDSPENLKALQFMVDGIKDGAAPKAVTTYMEEQARMSFEAGRATFMRNWPYAYAAGKKNAKTPDFKVVAFPRVRGRRQGRHPRRSQRRHLGLRQEPGRLAEGARLPLLGGGGGHAGRASSRCRRAIASAYDDPAVKKALPFSAELKQAISQAKPRPVSPVYPQISAAIYKNVNEALSGAGVA